jgi:hypothetical protein
MKVTLTEHDGCFELNLEAENLTEANQLVRLGMNRTNELLHCSAYAWKTGSFTFNAQFGKSKRSDSAIPRRKN